MEELKSGDSVVHKSNRRTVWIIEKIEKDLAYCSTLTKENVNQREVFALVTIEKYVPPTKTQITGISRNDFWDKNRY